MTRLLVVANTINIGADLGAMAAALRLPVDGPMLIYVVGFAVVTVLLEVFVRYSRYVSVLRWLTLSLFAYVATVFVVGVAWLTVARNLVLPHVSLSGGYPTVIVAVLGTTISPYLFFWQAGEEVEDEKEDHNATPLKEAPRQMARMQLDTIVGMGFSNLIARFIMVTTAATLNAHGITDIQTSSQEAGARSLAASPSPSSPWHHRHRAAGISGAGRQRRLWGWASHWTGGIGLALSPNLFHHRHIVS